MKADQWVLAGLNALCLVAEIGVVAMFYAYGEVGSGFLVMAWLAMTLNTYALYAAVTMRPRYER